LVFETWEKPGTCRHYEDLIVEEMSKISIGTEQPPRKTPDIEHWIKNLALCGRKNQDYVQQIKINPFLLVLFASSQTEVLQRQRKTKECGLYFSASVVKLGL
jgi:hypothetical protein